MAHIEKQAGELQEKLIAVNRVSKTVVVVFSPSQL